MTEATQQQQQQRICVNPNLPIYPPLTLDPRASQVVLVVKNPPDNPGDLRDMSSTPGSDDPLEEGMATPSNIFAWRSPWTEEPGGLQPIGSQRVGHD